MSFARRALAVAAGLCLALGCGRQTIELFDGCDACAPPDGAITPVADRDPERCGAAEAHCEDDEYCVAGSCVCREQLVFDGEDCIDPDSEREACGPGAAVCPTLCESGGCVSACSAGLTECEGGCVDVARHPLHCGECGRPCGANQICVAGVCQPFVPVGACDGCAGACCSYPGRPADLICVEADAC